MGDGVLFVIDRRKMPYVPHIPIQFALTGAVRDRIVPGHLGSRFLRHKQQLKPVRRILFRLSELCLGTKLKDAGHENPQDVKSPRSKCSTNWTILGSIKAIVSVTVVHVYALSASKMRKHSSPIRYVVYLENKLTTNEMRIT